MYYQNQFSEEQRSFMWWKKRQRKKYLESALMILFLEILVGTVFLCGQTETIELKDQIWYEWGIVKEKTRYNSQDAVRRYDKKRYYIKAQTSERVVEGECEFETYKKAKSGEKVLLFEIGTRMVYAVHPL